MQKDYQLVLFDLAVGGHHGTYIWHLVNYWCASKVAATLTIVVAPQFVTHHAEVVNFIDKSACKTITLLPISSDEFDFISHQKSFIDRVFAEWKLFCHYAHQVKANQGLLMQFDHLQLPIVFGERAPCSVAGIYFRPTFHYNQFSTYTPTWKDTFRRWRQKTLLRLALHSGQLNVLFSLDPFAPKYIAELGSSVDVFHLADPVQCQEIKPLQSDRLRTQLGVEPHRQIFLLFGKLDPRKGTHQLLEAIRQLPAELGQTLCLLLVGEIPSPGKARLKQLVSEVSLTSPVQILLHDEFVSESEVPIYFQLADVVLAPYQRHVGMSGILLQAAAAQKPVIASNYGLMGELVKRYKLGLPIDAEQPRAIANAMMQCLRPSGETVCDSQKMAELVEQNLTDRFVETLVCELIPPSSKPSFKPFSVSNPS
jgi:glycosyltransferase involved in cell wall biosynthesis